MPSAWQLPEDIADLLPMQAQRIEQLRRQWLDLALSYGYELVVPPMVEYLESLLSGAGHELELKTFKLVDQLTGRTMGLRADTTPQAARIDAHLLNRESVTRLCYCGPVVHTRAGGPMATREPLQFGAEVYGHAGLEADLEVLELALDGLARAGLKGMVVDLGDARVVKAVMAQEPGASASTMEAVATALVAKDLAALKQASSKLGANCQDQLASLIDLYGDASVLQTARKVLHAHPLLQRSLDDLAWLGLRLSRSHPDVRLSYDLSDHSGYAYYTGVQFSVHAHGAMDALVRGGRYDEVGAVFGRNRPAAGFSLDLKVLAGLGAPAQPAAAILAPWDEAQGLREAVRALRAQGETVLCVLPGHEREATSFVADRELALHAGQWVVKAIPA
jgi:ATP phosphoribosyltransferase regulatory subunit